MYRFDGDKLHRAVLAREMTIASFAEETNLTRTTIYRAIAGESVTMVSALRIANTLKRLPVNSTLEELVADVLDVIRTEPKSTADAAA
jgi:predicted transcriptional regulator